MKIKDIQKGIEDSLANLSTSDLPPALKGLRYLPTSDYNSQVSIRQRNHGRKVREDADASYFDPNECEVVIAFDSLETSDDEGPEAAIDQLLETSDDEGPEAAIDQLVDELKKVEGQRPFVGLKWFRDQVLPKCDHDWASDPVRRGSLLRHATNERIILTSQVHNPDQVQHPVTAIRVNRRHPRFQPEDSNRGAGFTPIRIRGGSISDTILGDRR